MEGSPRSVYELEDLNRTPIDKQTHLVEMSPGRVTRCAVYEIDGILDKWVRQGVRE